MGGVQFECGPNTHEPNIHNSGRPNIHDDGILNTHDDKASIYKIPNTYDSHADRFAPHVRRGAKEQAGTQGARATHREQ